jgi:hypothetical protein
MPTAKHQRDLLFFKARVLDQASLHDEMVETIVNALQIDCDSPLTGEERDAVATAFKSVVGLRRDSIRELATASARLPQPIQRTHVNSALDTLCKELFAYCQQLEELVDKRILPLCVHDRDGQIFFCRLRADYCRYQWEAIRSHPLSAKSSHENAMRASSLQFYDEALRHFLNFETKEFIGPADQSERNLFAELILNYSVFLREIGRSDEGYLLTQFAVNWLGRSVPDEDLAAGGAARRPSRDEDEAVAGQRMLIQLLMDNKKQWGWNGARFFAWCAAQSPTFLDGDLERYLFTLVDRPGV